VKESPSRFVKQSFRDIRRQVGVFITALTRSQPGDVRVTVKRNPVWTQGDYFAHSFRNTFYRLVWQSVNEVTSCGLVAQFPARIYNPFDIFERLNAVDGSLHFQIKILHTKTNSLETIFGQHLQLFRCRIVGMAFKTEFKPRMLAAIFKETFYKT